MDGKFNKHLATIVGLTLVLIVGCFVALMLGIGVSTFQTHQKEVEYQNIKSTAQALTQNPPVDVKMWKAKCDSKSNTCSSYNPEVHFYFEVTNRWDHRIAVLRAGPPDFYCWGSDIWYWLDPGEKSMVLECAGGLSTNLDISSLSNSCVSLFFEVSSYDPMYGLEPKPIICKDLHYKP